MGGSGFLPLFGGPGYEAALAAGIVLPSASAIATAVLVARTRPEPFDALGRGVALGFVLGLVALCLSVLHGLRVGFCDLGEGVTWFLLAPGPGSIMGGAWGAMAGLVAERVQRPVRRGFVATAVALFGPFATVAFSLYRFVSSPMVFAFDTVFGMFSGPLYDTVIDATDRLISLSSGHALHVARGGRIFWHFRREGSGFRFGSGRPVWRRGACAASVVAPLYRLR